MTEQEHHESVKRHRATHEAGTPHTPGPLSFDGKGINGPDEYRRRLFTARQADDRDDAAMLDAYGHLFAAAPELLEALQAIFEHCVMMHKHWGDGSNLQEANAAEEAGRAAIAKATGAP